MRVAPVGLVSWMTPKGALDIGARSAALTHGHPAGYWSAGALAAMVALLRQGSEPGPAAEAVLDLLESEAGAGETRQAVRQALQLAQDCPEGRPEDVRLLGEGWVGEEALAIGLYSVLCGRTFPDVLAIAANHDGDSDSTASIAGQVYGVWQGLDELPHAWVRRLDVFDPLVDLIGQLPPAATQNPPLMVT
jgi:ADP-ribosyl-[dinitrogen reductase] hydrolase